MNIFAKITERTMKKYKARTIVTIIGVILSTAMITAVTTFGSSLLGFLIEYSEKTDGKWHFAALNLSGEEADRISGLPEIRFSGSITNAGFALHAPAAKNSPRMPYLRILEPSEEIGEMIEFHLHSGRFPENDHEMMVPYYLTVNEKEGQETKLGDQLTLELGDRTMDGVLLDPESCYGDGNFENGKETVKVRETKTYTVVGFYDASPLQSSNAAYDCYTGPVKVHGEEQVTLYAALKNPREVYEFVRENLVESQVRYNGGLLRWLGAFDNDNVNPILNGLYTVLISVIMVGAVSLIYNAFSISLRERTVQFGILSSVGATKKQLQRTFLYEALAVSLIGIPLGILSGVVGIGVTLHFVGPGIAMFIHGVESDIALRVSVSAMSAAGVIAFLTVLISAWIPARRIRKLTPLQAIRSSEDIKITGKEVKTSKLTQKFFGLEGVLAKKNYQRDRRKYRTTVCSLTISIVLFVTASLYTEYLVKTGQFVLEAPAIEMRYTYYGEEVPVEKIREVVEEVPETKELWSLYSSYTELRTTYEKELESRRWFSENLEKDDGLYLSCNVMILPEEIFQSITGKSSEEYLLKTKKTGAVPVAYMDEIRSFNGETGRYERVEAFETLDRNQALTGGIMSYGEEKTSFQTMGEWMLLDKIQREQLPDDFVDLFDSSSPDLFVSEAIYEAYQECWTDRGTYEVLIKCPDYKKGFQALEKDMKEAGLLDENGSLMNLAEEYERDRGILLAIRVMTYGFVILISLIAVANIFHTISTNLLLRRKEFAMLRSMGMSRKGFRKMLSYECLIYGFRSIVYGVIFSVLMSFLLYQILYTGWDTAYLMPWSYLAIGAVGVLLVVAVTMIYTMRKIAVTNIVDELKMN